ncbi:VWA domain-containing protein [Acinetobacter defluvii]|uniref:VWA domain-containing protein n=1 Tax=Acinetobacter defluvii TaxID=1871111 RepID=A0A2S2FDN6_9GAMM|nr:VWA domain-containing protein [Acinetobacter defluvii]AWL29028.1 VWA domain-containing protein [Acinetobacter defluvii]
MQLVSGQKFALAQLLQSTLQFTVRVQVQASFEIDVSSFGLGGNNKLYHDDYMTFYNQPKTPEQEVQYFHKAQQHIFQFDLSQIDIQKTPRFVICATTDHVTLNNIQHIQVELLNLHAQVLASYQLTSTHFQQEKAAMLCEIYFKNADWRMAAIGQGFNGGLKALVEYFGGEVADENTPVQMEHAITSQSISSSTSTLDLKKKVVLDKIEKSAPQLLDLTKKSLLSLEKNNLLGVKARVALVLDYSGSMNQQYKKGDVQKVLDRIMPLAVNFDDDGSFECWAFAQHALRLSDVHLGNLKNYINTEQGGHKKWDAGARFNNEPAALHAVIDYFSKESPSELPVYVVFISDGGVSETKKIKQILKDASNQAIFWQFVGIGGRNYGALEQLDEMAGRVVDNCNFFAMDNIDSMPEAQLYDLLLNEFPMWLKAAQQKNIIK